MVRGKAGALDDLMPRTQALCLHLPWHRKVAYVDPRVLGMRVPLGLEDALPAEGVCPAEGLANRHSLPARRPSREVPMLYAVAMLASVALALVNAFFVAAEFAIVKIRLLRLEQLAARGQRRARVARGIARRLDAYLSANQLGITRGSAIPVKRDKLPSIAYSEELIFSMSATLQRTDRRHGIVGQERCYFQCDS